MTAKGAKDEAWVPDNMRVAALPQKAVGNLAPSSFLPRFLIFSLILHVQTMRVRLLLASLRPRLLPTCSFLPSFQSLSVSFVRQIDVDEYARQQIDSPMPQARIAASPTFLTSQPQRIEDQTYGLQR